MRMYPSPAVEAAMKRQEIILRAMSGELTWIQAASILAISPRALRRWRARWEHAGYDGLLDRRTRRPRWSTSCGSIESTTRGSTCATSTTWPSPSMV